MSLKEIANENRVITITPTGAASWTPGNPNYTDHPSDKVKADNSKILVSRISWIMPNCTKAGYTFVSGSTNTPIGPSIRKCHETNLPGWMGEPLAKGDKGNCLGTFSNPNPPFDVVFCTCDFEISNAGQTKSKGQ